MKRAGVAGIALRAGMYLIIRIDGVSASWWRSVALAGMYKQAGRGGRERAFSGRYEKAANLAAGLSFVVVFEVVLFKPDDLDADPVVHLFDALLERCQLITDKYSRGLLHVTH